MKKIILFIAAWNCFNSNVYSQWQPAFGPPTSEAGVYNLGKNLLACTSDGISRSATPWNDWYRVPDLPFHFSYLDASVSVDTSQVILSAGDGYCNCPKLFRSTDQGDTWTSIAVPGFADWIPAIFSGPDNLVIISIARLNIENKVEYSEWISHDGGANYSKLDLGFGENVVVGNYKQLDNFIWGHSANALFRGTLEGNDWEIFAAHLDTFAIRDYSVSGNRMLIYTNSGWYKYNLWRSTTGGIAWNKVPDPPGNLENVEIWNDIIYAEYSDGIIRSGDFGLTWEKVSHDTIKVSRNFCTADNNIILYDQGKGIAISNDWGKNFYSTGIRLGYASHPERMAVINEQIVVTQGHSDDEVLFSYDNQSGEWNVIPSNLPSGIWTNLHDIYWLNGKIVLSHFFIFGSYVSEDMGLIWISIEALNPDVNTCGDELFSIGETLFAFNKSIYGPLMRSDDFGYHWRVVTPVNDNCWTAVDFAGHVGDKLYAGLRYSDCLFVSSDLGDNWQTIDLPVLQPETDTGEVYIGLLTTTGKRLLLTMAMEEKGKVEYSHFVSNDEGKSWMISTIKSPSNLHNYNYLTSIALELDEITILSLQNKGVLISSDSGLTWNLFSDGLPSYYINDIVTDDHFVYVTVDGHGLWKRPVSDFYNATNPEQKDAVSTRVYPNPNYGLVRLSTEADFGQASVMWYDIAGRFLLTQKADFTCREAILELPFNSGVYFYKVTIDGLSSSSGKIVLVKQL